MSPRIREDRINGVRVIRSVRGSVYEELGLVRRGKGGPDGKRPVPHGRPNDLVTAEYDSRLGGIAVRAPDGGYLLGNRGVPFSIPRITRVADVNSYPLVQVHWHDSVARTGLVSLGQLFPGFPAGGDPLQWSSLAAHLEWSQGSSSYFTADVDVDIGTSFPITFSSLSVFVAKFFPADANFDATITAFAAVAPISTGIGRPKRTLATTLKGSGLSFFAQVSRPSFGNHLTVKWDDPRNHPMTVTYVRADGSQTKDYAQNGAPPFNGLVVPNNCYAVRFDSDYAANVEAIFDLDIR